VPKVFDVVTWLPAYSWFVGCAAGYVSYIVLARMQNVAGSGDRPLALIGDVAS
jgi:cytosine/uracil/thiamine/allantoin permease